MGTLGGFQIYTKINNRRKTKYGIFSVTSSEMTKRTNSFARKSVSKKQINQACETGEALNSTWMVSAKKFQFAVERCDVSQMTNG